MPTLRANGINIYYEQTGSGPDLVFISGLGADHSTWDVSRYADKFRVLTFDNRGAGQTDTPDGPYSMQMFADDTLALCRALKIKKAHFVGHSMGGHIAQLIAAHTPEIVDKAILACSEQEFSVISYLATKLQLELRQHRIPKNLLLEAYLPVVFAIEFLEDEARVKQICDKILSNPHFQSDKGYVNQVEAIRKHDTKSILSKIKCPTLVIGCTEDLLTPFKNSEYLHKHIPHSQLKKIRNCGHLPMAEKPEEFVKIVRDFLH
jgi:pimeloyl-ACP methyl ester carboxylesterase